MRLYDTATRGLRELPPPPGPVRMYFCGPTVYQRIHVGNARPFVLSMWLKRWLEHGGYEVTLVENITDVNDKIYAAAPGASAKLAADASDWYVEDTSGFGLGRPDREPKATESIPEIVAMIEQLVAGGHAYPAGGDVYFRVASFPDYGKLSGRHGDEEATRNPSEEDEAGELKEDPRDFALWKAHKEGEDTWWDSPWGRGRPGWHIECSAMAETHLGPVFEIHGGGIDLVFPHHENEVAQSRSLGHEFAQLWMHNGMLRLAGEKMSKSLGNIVSLREAIETWGRETLLVYFLGGHWRKPLDYSDEVLRQAAAQAESFRNVFRQPSEPGGDWEAFATALDDDFNTPEALAILHGWRNHELLRRAWRSSGSSPSPRALRLPGSSKSWRGGVQRPVGAEISTRATGCAARSRPPVGKCGTWTPSPASSSCRSRDDRARLRPPSRAGGRSRTAAGVRALRHRAGAEGGALAGRDRGASAREAGAGAERAAGTADHQGVVARVEPFRYADAHEVAAGPAPLLAVLDSVTDPRNLGAVARSAEGAGASGIVLPAHNSARVTAAVCRASAGAVEHLPVAVVKNLSRYLGEIKGPRLWVWAAAGDAETTMWDADLSGGVAFVLGAEGKGLRPLVRRTCDDAVRIPLQGKVESLNVSVAAALLLYEARRQRGG